MEQKKFKTILTAVLIIIQASYIYNYNCNAQIKNSPKVTSNEKIELNIDNRISPARAGLYSMIAPGLGQIYNKKYWKLPLVWGGFVGLGYMYGFTKKKYNEYKIAYKDIIDNDPSTTSYLDLTNYTQEEYDKLSESQKSSITDQIKNGKDYYKENNDLSLILLFVLYGLTIIDACVDAHLVNYNISDDLSLNIEPYYHNDYTQSTTGIKLSFRF